jgi:hypothetical protein
MPPCLWARSSKKNHDFLLALSASVYPQERTNNAFQKLGTAECRCFAVFFVILQPILAIVI